jgi:putative hemolysin
MRLYYFIASAEWNTATDSIADASYLNSRRSGLFEFAALRHRQVRLLMDSSERSNTRATHIQCCPCQPRRFAAVRQHPPC